MEKVKKATKCYNPSGVIGIYEQIRDPGGCGWIAEWREGPNKRKNKWFGYSFGNEEERQKAKKKAIKLRKQMEKKYYA